MNSEPATSTDFAWLGRLLQAGDTFYPTGSYAHSFGLEGLVAEGVVRDLATLRRFLRESTLPALQQSELPLTAHAWRALGAAPDWAAIGELCVLSSALKTAHEARTASADIGRQRVELLGRLTAAPLAQELVQRAGASGWPYSSAVAAALEGRVFGAPLPAVLGGVYYTTLAGQLAAAMKLLRLGQNAAQGLLTELLGEAPAVLRAAEAVPREDIGWFNPWLDIAAARHATADARLFIS
ncbi:MAG: urease accessory protein UreF [Opitutales bacterium]